MNQEPLRYRISSLRQLPECLSNTSTELHIHTSDYVQNDVIRGFQISIDHDRYGRLFSYIVNPVGSAVDPSVVTDMPTSVLMNILSRYGFLVEYSPGQHLSPSQLDYLQTINRLGYDKIRTLLVRSKNSSYPPKKYVVVFKINAKMNGNWLDNTYICRYDEFNDALRKGSAVVVSALDQFRDFPWDWLNYVANISDILRDNTGDGTWI